MSEASKAVFLSYAREDTAAAQRIAEALRSHGVEVWFDQSELRGGDAWDQKIRRQISECTLFLPVISHHTQERHKGYFRLEWKLAVEQTHQMAEGVAFVAPVVVDSTSESSAVVPSEFMRVQWTRLPGALPTPQFVEQIKLLLEAPHKATSATRPGFPVASSFPPIAAGSHSRRKIPLAIAAVAALVLAGAAYFALRPAAQITDKSIAILPFTNMSDDKENTAFFSDGIHEDILTNLANIKELRVVSRTSVMDYRNTTKKIPEIARELGVAYILEGSVQRSGNTVRITGQLIRANDVHLWAKAYDRDLTATNVFGIQAALATEIAGSLRAVLSPEEKSLVERRPTENLAAYDLYLRGRDSDAFLDLGGNSPAAMKQRESYLQTAVSLDPNFAEAWGELAVVHSLQVFWNRDNTPARLAQADAAIGRAVSLAPNAPEIIRLAGRHAYHSRRDYARATAEIEKVIRLQPNNPDAIYDLAAVQRRQGRWLESMANMRKAIDLDPASIRKRSSGLRSTLLAGRRWVDAIAAQREIVALRPDLLAERILLADLFYQSAGSTKERDDLLAALSPAQRESPQFIDFRKTQAARKRDFTEWMRLDRLQPYFDEIGVPRWEQALTTAIVMAAFGDSENARARLGDYPADVRAELVLQPTNWGLLRSLSTMEALLGEKEAALRDARKALEVFPESRDALSGPSQNLATVYALTGDKDRAIAELARIIKIPFTGVPSGIGLKNNPVYASLRGDPRFEALVNDPKNNAPLF